MIFKLRDATNRKTKCYWLNIFDVRVLISYETPVAFEHFSAGRMRRKNDWGPTTGRHMRECSVDGWTVVEDGDEFDRMLDRAIMANILRDKALVEDLVIQAVSLKLVPEVA